MPSKYKQLIHDTMLNSGVKWSDKKEKYSGRFAKYFDKLEDDIGKPITDVDLYRAQGKKIGGPVFTATDSSGKQYVVEIPHSPGGVFMDYDTRSLGWKSLGLGDLGGEGNEKISKKTSASYTPMESFKGLPSELGIWKANVNPAGKKFGIGELATLASLVAGGYGLYNMFTGIPGAVSNGMSAFGELNGLVEAAGSAAGAGGAAGAAGAGSVMSQADMMNLMGDFLVDDKIQVLTNMGLPESIATSIGPSLSGEMLQSLINLGPDALKSLVNFTGGDTNSIISTLGKLFGNNLASNAVDDTIDKWLDEIKKASPFSRSEVDALGDRAIDLANRDYLAPEFENLMGQYESRGAGADQFANYINDAYYDPLNNNFVSALADLASNKAMRASGAAGRLNSGSLETDQYNAMMAGVMPFLQQGTSHLGTLYQGQNVPINMINALNQADQTAWGGATNLARTAQGDQNAIAGFVKDFAAPKDLQYNSTLQGMNTLYSPYQGVNTNPGPSWGGKAVETGVKWGLDKLASLF